MDGPLESLSLVGKEVLDVGAAGEDPLQVDPPSLDVDPDVKGGVDPVQPLLPLEGIVLKHLQGGDGGEVEGEGKGEGRGGIGTLSYM